MESVGAAWGVSKKQKRENNMEIETLVLTDKEMNQAVQTFLAWRNIQVEVKEISGKGYPRRGWEFRLDVKTEEMVAPPLPIIKPITTVLASVPEKGEETPL